MRHPDDTVTADLPGVPPAKVSKPRSSKYASEAEKQAAYRARKGVTVMTVQLPKEVHAAFVAKLAATGKKQSDVIAKLIKTQFLRER
ncbi:hypothetical protein [Duganella sp. BuS-21]|uniref:hypothetical protein n=1 Tax=Duganella sp. BuS-21 TaxID=2943848 RepID=UPI0035A58DE8